MLKECGEMCECEWKVSLLNSIFVTCYFQNFWFVLLFCLCSLKIRSLNMRGCSMIAAKREGDS